MSGISSIVSTFTQEYKKTPVRLKIIDAFLVYAAMTALIQYLYLFLFGSFPFNSFLAGFFCCLGFFVLTVSLRMQVDPNNDEFKSLTPKRAFADYALANLILFLLVWNYMG